MLEQVSTAMQPELETDTGTNIVLNSTSEFCRNLGEIPTYGLSGNREEERDEIMVCHLKHIFPNTYNGQRHFFF